VLGGLVLETALPRRDSPACVIKTTMTDQAAGLTNSAITDHYLDS